MSCMGTYSTSRSSPHRNLSHVYGTSVRPMVAIQTTAPFYLGFFIYLFFPLLLPFFFPPAAAAAAAPFFFPSALPNAAFCLKYTLTTFSTLPLSCFSLRMYVNLALLAFLCARCTTSIPSTSGEYTLYHISTPTRVSWPRSRMAVSMPRRRILMQTPAKGSPVRWRTRRMSPTRAHSGFRRSKRRVRAPVGSWMASWEAVRAERGSGQVFLMARGFWGCWASLPVAYRQFRRSKQQS